MKNRSRDGSPRDIHAGAYGSHGDAYALDRGPASSPGRRLLERARSDPRAFVRKLVIGEAIGVRPRRVLGLRRPPARGR